MKYKENVNVEKNGIIDEFHSIIILKMKCPVGQY